MFALILGTAFGVAAAIFLAEGFMADGVIALLKIFKLQFHPFWGKLPEQAENLLRNLIELLAAIPSVVYGLWGMFVVIPLIRPVCNWLHAKLGWIPLFGTDLSGPGMLPAVIVLSIMILPTITAISRGALVAVPPGCGWPHTGWARRDGRRFSPSPSPPRHGAFSAAWCWRSAARWAKPWRWRCWLGNANVISFSLFSPANTLAALLANKFPEAGPKDVGVLMYAAPVLLAITLLVNAQGPIIVQCTSSGPGRCKGMTTSGSHGECRSPAASYRTGTRIRFAAGLFQAGAIAAAAADFPEHVVQRDHAAMTLLALMPLFSVVGLLVWRGGRKLSLAAFTSFRRRRSSRAAASATRSLGTLMMVGIAAADQRALRHLQRDLPGAIETRQPTGRLGALCGKGAHGISLDAGRRVRLRGRGLVTGGFSALAGGVALSLLMLPTILLTAEDAIRMVPAGMHEAAIGMGATDTQTIWMVMLPTAMPGILTGVMLAVARAAGETAPLLFTALFSNYWPIWHGHGNLMQPTASLAVLIYNFSGMPFENQIEMAWAAALVLVLLVLTTNLIGQSLSRKQVDSTRS